MMILLLLIFADCISFGDILTQKSQIYTSGNFSTWHTYHIYTQKGNQLEQKLYPTDAKEYPASP